MKFSEVTIAKIERNLKAHINYEGRKEKLNYLKEMDNLTWNYSGPRGLALSDLLNDYFKQVGVSNLSEALERLKRLEEQ